MKKIFVIALLVCACKTPYENAATWPQGSRTEFVSTCVAEAKKTIAAEKADKYCECAYNNFALAVGYGDFYSAPEATLRKLNPVIGGCSILAGVK